MVMKTKKARNTLINKTKLSSSKLGYEGQYVFILPSHNMVVTFKSQFKKTRDILIPKALVEEFLLN